MSFALAPKYGNAYILIRRELVTADVKFLKLYPSHWKPVGSFKKDGYGVIPLGYKNGKNTSAISSDDFYSMYGLCADLNMNQAGSVELWVSSADIVFHTKVAHLPWSSTDGTQCTPVHLNSCKVNIGISPRDNMSVIPNWNISNCTLSNFDGGLKFLDCKITNSKFVSATGNPNQFDNLPILHFYGGSIQGSTITGYDVVNSSQDFSQSTLIDCKLSSGVPVWAEFSAEEKFPTRTFKACVYRNSDIDLFDDCDFRFEDCPEGDAEFGVHDTGSIGIYPTEEPKCTFTGKGIPTIRVSRAVSDSSARFGQGYMDGRKFFVNAPHDAPVNLGITDMVIDLAKVGSHFKGRIPFAVSTDNGTIPKIGFDKFGLAVHHKVKMERIASLKGDQSTLHSRFVFETPVVVNADLGLDEDCNIFSIIQGDGMVIDGQDTLYNAFYPFFHRLFTALDKTAYDPVQKRLKTHKLTETDPRKLAMNPPEEIRRIRKMVKLLNPRLAL